MKNLTSTTAPTFESVWALVQETGRQMQASRADYDQQLKETDRQMQASRADFDRQMQASRADFDREMQASRADYDRRMKKMEETLGSWANNHGEFAEDYFFNSFEQGQKTFFGEKFEDIEKRVKGIKKGFKDEYDILLMNGKSIGIIEVKFKAHANDIPKVLRKAETFRVNYPEYANHQIYLGLATMSFYPELETECIEQGIAIIKQVGDVVVINDEHLKVF